MPLIIKGLPLASSICCPETLIPEPADMGSVIIGWVIVVDVVVMVVVVSEVVVVDDVVVVVVVVFGLPAQRMESFLMTSIILFTTGSETEYQVQEFLSR